VGFKVILLLLISAAWAVSIEFPSLGLSHPNSLGRMTPIESKDLSDAAKALDAVKPFSIEPGALYLEPPQSKALTEFIARSTVGDTHPFPDLLPPDAKSPQFAFSFLAPALDWRKHGRVCASRTWCRRRH
jgi:hypothetical protein